MCPKRDKNFKRCNKRKRVCQNAVMCIQKWSNLIKLAFTFVNTKNG